MEPLGSRPAGRGRSKESSRNPSRMPSRGGLSAPSGTSMEGEDWDAMVKSFLKAEIERTEQRQEWLREKLEAAKELAVEDTRGDGYQVRSAPRSSGARCACRPRREPARKRDSASPRLPPPKCLAACALSAPDARHDA